MTGSSQKLWTAATGAMRRPTRSVLRMAPSAASTPCALAGTSCGDGNLRELAILIDRAAAVRLWLDRNGSEPRVIVEDLERGDYVSLNAIELIDLILDRQEHQE